jgi:hypothetical protein
LAINTVVGLELRYCTVEKARKPVVSDGPLSAAPQLASAFFIIDADSIDEATAIVSNHAGANYGEHVGMAVEVRQCESYE